MRNTFPIQRTIGQIDIADITIDVRSRDDIPLILLGLQHLYCTDDLREKVFEIIKEILPTQVVDGQAKPVSAELGCLGMNQWTILVLGCLRLCLNADFDRLHELANQHRTLRLMLGIADWDEKIFSLQTLKDNLQLFTPDILARVNQAVVEAGYALLGKKTASYPSQAVVTRSWLKPMCIFQLTSACFMMPCAFCYAFARGLARSLALKAGGSLKVV
jgi:transposase, IS5 family